MSYRATKSGFAAEAQSKALGKYDPELARETMEWIKHMTKDANLPTSGELNETMGALNDGVVLLKLCQALGRKTSEKDLKPVTMAFKKMEKIDLFLKYIDEFGVPSQESFQTVDLYEQQNPAMVITCLGALGRKAQAKGYPGIGPKEATANKREFTEEQLKAGQGVIGLQMGTNKGASQAGQSFGKSRSIVD